MAMTKIPVFENTEVAFRHKSTGELLKLRLLFQLMGNPKLVSWGGHITEAALKWHLPVSSLYRLTIYNQFCGGETLEECMHTVDTLAKSTLTTMLNYGVEFKETEDDFDAALHKNLEAIHFSRKNKNVTVLCVKPTGYGRLQLFEKMQSGQPLTKAEKKELEKVKHRFYQISEAGRKAGISIYFDAEESWIQDSLDQLVEEMMKIFNQEEAVVFNTFQLYRHDRLAFLKAQGAKAKKSGYWLGAKIVRGAYMEKERLRANEMNYPSPIHDSKKLVDTDFAAAVRYCLENLSHINVCIASQSEESNYEAMAFMKALHIPANSPQVIFSQLYGMGDHISYNMAELGYRVCKYLPFGPVKEVIPYLIRRAQENTSVSGQVGRELSLIQREIERRKTCR